MRKGVCSFLGAVIFMVSACFWSETNGDMMSTRMTTDNSCDMFEGSWVFDDSYPLYNSEACPFIRNEFNCIKFGRTDLQYLKYRWQPKDCDLPRYTLTLPTTLKIIFGPTSWEKYHPINSGLDLV